MRDQRDPETLGLAIQRVMERGGLSVLDAADLLSYTVDPIKSQTTNVPVPAPPPPLESPPQNGSEGVLPRSCTCSPNIISWECPWHGF